MFITWFEDLMRIAGNGEVNNDIVNDESYFIWLRYWNIKEGRYKGVK